MCGLVFIYDSSRGADALELAGTHALSRLAHRGPDAQGKVCEQFLFIGHRRLSIIDVAGSRQPMSDRGGRYLLAYNGEVYNYQYLRSALAGRWVFESLGDTEVVLAGLACLGTVFLERMQGMWALALWDRQEHRLLLARDRLGKKPLYYARYGNGIAVASELPALLSVLPYRPEEDLDSTADYLRYGYCLPGTTAYLGIREVLPAHSLLWQPSEQGIESRYWSLPTHRFIGTERQAREQLIERITSAVASRLVADVEVGTFLSGGIDSSLIASVLAKRLGVKLKTFTVGFPQASHDESGWARELASICGTDHHEKILANWNADLLKRLIFRHVGQPFMDSSLLPTAVVSEMAAKKVRVALSGDGGDELFSGYQRYQARAILRWYTRLPQALRHLGERLIRTLPEPMAHHSRSLLKKAHLFVDIADRLQWETPYVAPLLYSQRQFQYLAPDLIGRGHPPPALPPETQVDEIGAMMAADALIYMPQDILVKVDRASMAHSVEVRAPLLDHKLVEFAFSLPRRWHRRGLEGKRLIRGAFADLLPAGVWQRRKQGFAAPIHHWFRAELGNELEHLIHCAPPLLNKAFITSLLRTHRERKRDHGYRLWQLYVYLLWVSEHPT